MDQRLISGDNHIDLTYLPPDVWANPPAKWRLLAPRVEELEDGCHWFVEAQDKGMWNGVGPGFLKYAQGTLARIDVMKDLGFEWDYRPGAKPRPTTPETRIADLDRDGVDAEIVYGCLMINEMIADGKLRLWCDQQYNDWAADFAKRSDPKRVFPLALIPNNDPHDAAAEIRRCAKMGLRGGDFAFKRMSVPLYTHLWDPMWEAARLLPAPGLRDVPAGPVPGTDRAAHRRGQHPLGRGLSASGLSVARLAQDPRQEPQRLLRERASEDHLRQRGEALQHLKGPT